MVEPPPEEELLLRWIQNGIFQPRFCINSANSDNTVTQPWMYENVVDHVREAFAQRYRMLPYLYSLMWEAHRDGMPAMRPLFLEFPDESLVVVRAETGGGAGMTCRAEGFGLDQNGVVDLFDLMRILNYVSGKSATV